MSDIVERLLSRPDDLNPVLKQDAAAEIKRLRDVLEGMASDFDRARDASRYVAEAQRLDACARLCRTSKLPSEQRGT